MIKPNFIENKIKDVILKNKIEENFICTKLKINRKNFSKCLNGERKFRADEFISICLFLNLNLNDFLN